MDDGYNRRQKLAALAGQRAATEEERLRYRVAELEAGAESLRSSLRAAEAERDDARALYTETEIAAANMARDLDREVGAVEDRLRAAEERAEAAERWLAGVREDFRLYAINAERRAEGLEEAAQRVVLADDEAVRHMGAQERVEWYRSFIAAIGGLRAALARPRSEDE